MAKRTGQKNKQRSTLHKTTNNNLLTHRTKERTTIYLHIELKSEQQSTYT